MNEILVKPGVTIDLGKRGENMARCAVFDVSAWQKTYGEGTVHLLHQRNGDKEPYPCVIEVEGGNVYWPFAETDVAVAGYGSAELQYFVGETRVKSETWRTRTDRGLNNAGATPDPPAENWLNTMLELGTETQENAQAAQMSEQSAQENAQAAQMSAQSAEESESQAQEHMATAREQAELAQEAAEATELAKDAAAESESNAATSAQAAAESETRAEDAAVRAEAVRDSVAVNEEALLQAVSSSQTNAANAAGSAMAAATSESNAKSSATASATSAGAAATSASNAAASVTAARAAQTAAEKARDEAAKIAEGDYLSRGGDTMRGAIQLQPDGSDGYGTLYKNANADGDYGIQLQDTDPDGNFVGLAISGKLQRLEIEKKLAGEGEYRRVNLYDEDNPPSAREVGALPAEGGELTGALDIASEYAHVNLKASGGHSSTLMKSADGDNDNGTILRDTNGANVVELKLNASEGSLKFAKGGNEFRVYTEETPMEVLTSEEIRDMCSAIGFEVDYTPAEYIQCVGDAYINTGVAGSEYISGDEDGKIYARQIYDNGVLVRDYVPCYRNSDGEVGLYDKVNYKFYGNAGAGSFVASDGTGLKSEFSENEWAAINMACKAGIVPDTWVAGKKKSMTINGANYVVDIIGRNHDDYADGSGKAPLTFQLHDQYGTTYKMNNSATNSGGWASCAMRTTSLPAIMALMPAEVQSSIREVNKLTSAGNKSTAISTTADKLFLLSEVEVCGTSANSAAGEGVQYAYYAAGNDKKKNLNNRAENWWLRSPNPSNASNFCIINSSGSPTSISATYVYGPAYAFCF